MTVTEAIAVLRGFVEKVGEPDMPSAAEIVSAMAAIDAIDAEVAPDDDRHILDLGADGYGLQHPRSCRPDLLGCAYNEAAQNLAGDEEVHGRWHVVLDGETLRFVEMLGRESMWREDPQLAHLREDAPYDVCSGCGRKSWAEVEGSVCGMPQPDGSVCDGVFVPESLDTWHDQTLQSFRSPE